MPKFTTKTARPIQKGLLSHPGILRNGDKDAEGTTIKFLGRIVDSTTFTVSISKDKVYRVISLAADALASDSMTIHEAQQLAGLLSFCTTAVFCRRIWSFVASADGLTRSLGKQKFAHFVRLLRMEDQTERLGLIRCEEELRDMLKARREAIREVLEPEKEVAYIRKG